MKVWMIWVQTDAIVGMSAQEAAAQKAAGPGLWKGPYRTYAAAKAAEAGQGPTGPGGPGGKPPKRGKRGSGQPVSGAAIAADALRYVGAPYVYGGNTPHGWDCSGFVTWVLRHDFRMQIMSPRPVVMTYARWSRARTIPFSQCQAGDLCIWAGLGPNGHIGIAVSPKEMVSALDPAMGTAQTPILGTGPSSAPFMVRRVGADGAISTTGLVGCMPGAQLIARLAWLSSLKK